MRAIPEIHHIALVGGDFDVILLVRAIDNTDLRRVIFDQLQSMPGVLDTQTFLVFEDVDTRRVSPRTTLNYCVRRASTP